MEEPTNRVTPRDSQVCYVELEDGSQQYAVWNTGYSLYGSGGHFQFGDGSMAGIPVDIKKWWGTHWLVAETPGIQCSYKGERMNTNDYAVKVFWSDEDEGFIALVPDLPGCSAFGVTRSDAVAEIEDAITAWIKSKCSSHP